jgi:hypothetical protein
MLGIEDQRGKLYNLLFKPCIDNSNFIAITSSKDREDKMFKKFSFIFLSLFMREIKE